MGHLIHDLAEETCNAVPLVLQLVGILLSELPLNDVPRCGCEEDVHQALSNVRDKATYAREQVGHIAECLNQVTEEISSFEIGCPIKILTKADKLDSLKDLVNLAGNSLSFHTGDLIGLLNLFLDLGLFLQDCFQICQVDVCGKDLASIDKRSEVGQEMHSEDDYD